MAKLMADWRERIAPMREERRRFLTEGNGKPKFKINLFVAKAYEDEAGAWYVEGVASGTRIDSQDDRMMPECIRDMAMQINSGMIPFCTTHWDSDWNDEFGYMVSGEADPMDQLRVKVWLDRQMNESQKLWRKLQGVPEQGIPPRKLGMSIGGYVEDGRWETANGQNVYSIYKLKLVHNVPTAMPAYPDATITGFYAKDRQFAQDWQGAIFKSIRRRQPSGSEPAGHVHGAEGGEMDKDKKAAVKSATETPPAVQKADGEAEPTDGEQPPQGDESTTQEWTKGRWVLGSDCTEDMSFWCNTPESQKSQTGGDVISKEKFDGLEAKVDGVVESVKTLADTTKAVLETLKGQPAAGSGGDPAKTDVTKTEKTETHEEPKAKGLHATGDKDDAIAKGRDGKPESKVKAITNSEAYQKADRLTRYQMLQDNLDQAIAAQPK